MSPFGHIHDELSGSSLVRIRCLVRLTVERNATPVFFVHHVVIWDSLAIGHCVHGV
jgi:hypothetical protein